MLLAICSEINSFLAQHRIIKGKGKQNLVFFLPLFTNVIGRVFPKGKFPTRYHHYVRDDDIKITSATASRQRWLTNYPNIAEEYNFPKREKDIFGRQDKDAQF